MLIAIKVVSMRGATDCDSYLYGASEETHYWLYLPNDDRPHGFVTPWVVEKMPWTEHFLINHQIRSIRVNLPTGTSVEDYSSLCTAYFSELVKRAIDHATFPSLNGEHSEPFAIMGAKHPVSIERFAASLFGIVHRGAHMTAYTKSTDGYKIWVPRRSASLKAWPGALDSTVAGGVRAGESPFACIVHEASEEASLPEDLVRGETTPCGVLSYMSQPKQGLATGLIVPVVLYTYDIELEHDVTPAPNDGEVEKFELLTVEQVMESMLQRKFKANSAMVMIDFFIRHGIITPETEADYIEIVARMHRNLPFPTSPGAASS